MDIIIEQSKISLTDNYRIFVEGKEEYNAKVKTLSVKRTIELNRLDGENLAVIKQNFSILKLSYVCLIDNQSYTFKSLSYFKPKYRCFNQKESYEIFGHKGNNWSIFSRRRQIAAFKKNTIKVDKGDEFFITANNSVNTLLVIGMVLIIDQIKYTDDSGMFDIGNLFEGRKKDETWSPKENN